MSIQFRPLRQVTDIVGYRLEYDSDCSDQNDTVYPSTEEAQIAKCVHEATCADNLCQEYGVPISAMYRGQGIVPDPEVDLNMINGTIVMSLLGIDADEAGGMGEMTATDLMGRVLLAQALGESSGPEVIHSALQKPGPAWRVMRQFGILLPDRFEVGQFAAYLTELRELAAYCAANDLSVSWS